MKFNIAAKINHSIYGIWIYAAIGFILKYKLIISNTNKHNKISQINANKYILTLKNIIGQVKLIINPIPYTISAFFLILESFFNTMYDEIPINIYKIVQTIGNTMGGGEKDGLLTLWL